ncbi:hypothetical protein [Rathayibacter tanaceti]|uniref:hypothetical protein n=1 Tax=Rathayibacter tanaceti TaxID=1671680 RepID=UPI0013729D44|nr:hypothetical protein [Rathayibacter tanaceti]
MSTTLLARSAGSSGGVNPRLWYHCSAEPFSCTKRVLPGPLSARRAIRPSTCWAVRYW